MLRLTVMTLHGFRIPAVLLSVLAVGCMAGEADMDPGSSDKNDTLCEIALLENVFLTADEVAVERDGNSAEYKTELEVTSANEFRMEVDTEALVFDVDPGDTLRLSIDAPLTELFSDFVFDLAVQLEGSDRWEDIRLDASFKGNPFKIFWYDQFTFNFADKLASFETTLPCFGSSQEDLLPLDLNATVTRVRVRVFPFAGAGDLEGVYDYTVHAEWE